MSDVFDYFHMFDLSRQDTRQDNYKKLQHLLYEANQGHGRQAEARQLVLNVAVAIFKDQTEYQNYLEKLNARNSSTDSTWQTELEKAHQNAQKAQIEAEAAKRRAAALEEQLKQLKKLNTQNSLITSELEAKLKKAQHEAKDAEQRAIDAEKQVTSPLKTGWHKAGEYLKGQLNLSSNSLQATAIDLLADYFSNKQTQKPQSSNNQQPIINQQPINQQLSINLSGNWRDVDGTFAPGLNYSINHRGSWLVMQGMQQILWNSVVVLHAEGQISGQYIQMEYRATTGGYGFLELEISADGRSMEGRCANNATGAVFLLRFVRI